ncbi:MAG: DUF4249 domain-containing protein [Flavobacteriaceae bacterium]|nr:DUF4249 domain-containing protein [Flavobacteriaceae bacterium]
MKIKTWTYKVLLFSTYVFLWGCVEEISFETQDLESALVVEATITDELKQQEIRLSRTYEFDEGEPTPETGARVWLESEGAIISFQESSEAGVYLSTSSYAAEGNRSYELHIETNDGSSYNSRPEQMVAQVPIESVYAVREANDFGDDGISIFVDSFDPSGLADYYRFEYEETYKIIAPLWTATSMIASDEECLVTLGEREQEERVCFNTEASTNVNLVNTSGLSESRVVRHLVRFIDADNFIISHRYSILLRQYVQSREAHTFYRLLDELSQSESLFSQNQPGFFAGNISSNSNADEKVVGYFDVAGVSERRLYFNYEDFFPNEPLPPYASGCTEIAPELYTSAGTCGPLYSGVRNNELRYIRLNDAPSDIFPGPYIVVARACGDCTALGTNIPPDFWEE